MMFYCVLQIQSFIKGLGLRGAAIIEKKETVSDDDVEDERDLVKKNKKAKAKAIKEDKLTQKMEKKERKKKDSVKSEGEKTVQEVDQVVSDQLLRLSAKSYKRLLVSMDNEAMWYDQVGCHYDLKSKCSSGFSTKGIAEC